MANDNVKITPEVKARLRVKHQCFKLTCSDWYGNFELVTPLKGLASNPKQELETRLCNVKLHPLLNPQNKKIKAYVLRVSGTDDYSYSRDFETELEGLYCYNLILAEPVLSLEFLEELGFTFSN